MLPVPLATDRLKLADWVELSALLSGDRNVSMGDLSSVLSTGSILDAEDEDAEAALRETIEQRVLGVFNEIETRATAAAEAYPFTLESTGVVTTRIDADQFSAYTFCLCLSYAPGKPRIGHLYPYRMFEDLAVVAARNFIGGEAEAVRFASPRRDLPKAFTPALTHVCTMMAEGSTRVRQQRASKDAKLDVVAWRHFPDRLPGKLLLFGQCAAGDEWENKLGELQPDNFCGAWLSEQPASQRVKAFFIPHRVDKADWEDAARHGGLLFDRCRLAYWVHTGVLPTDTVPYVEWIQGVLQGLA
jgi:hypothetical protein